MARVLFLLSIVLLVFLAPVAVRAVLHRDAFTANWWAADRSSARLLPPATPDLPASVRVFSARTVSWRGIFAVHSWIVLKDAGCPYERYDLTAWGEPIRVNGFVPDGRWFGQTPMEVFAADGARAEAMIPPMRDAIRTYRYQHLGDYAAWPGPNSNTFVATVMAAVPDIRANLPATAIGKDFPVDGRWFAPTPSRTGVRVSLGGYCGITLAWVEGLQVNLLGLAAGIDLQRPGIELPGLGRFGWP